MKTAYEQLEIHSSLEESMDAIWDSVANVTNVVKGSSRNGRIGLKSEAINGQNRSFSIDGLEEDDFVIETLETEPIDDATAHSDSPSVNSNETESDTNATQNIPDAHKPIFE